jgi:hypothetical protein
LVKFYIWLALKDVDLSKVAARLRKGADGDGSTWSEEVTPKKKTRFEAQAGVFADVLKTLGYGKPQGADSGQSEARLKEAAIEVQIEQKNALKASSLKSMFECDGVPTNMKNAALAKWAAVLGVTVEEDA